MSLVKIYSNDSPKQVMFIDNELSRWAKIFLIFTSRNINLNLDRGFKNVIEKEDLIKILISVDTWIEALLNDSSFVLKESGYSFEFKGNHYFLNTKKYDVDKEITTLNSLKKIVTLCLKGSSNLVVTSDC